MDIHEKLRRMMADRGWSEYRLAKNCGLSESTLANVFRRNTLPTVATLEAVCSAFGITLSQFFAEGEMVELSPDLQELFEGWKGLTVEQKKALMALIKSMQA